MSAPMQQVRPAAQGQDAISTSSSTLVNPEQEERSALQSAARHGKSRRPSRFQHLHLTEAMQTDAGKQRNLGEGMSMNASGWTKRYPDDHRCSDVEIEGGLCTCMRISSPSSQSDSNNEQIMISSTSGEDAEANYQRRLYLARKRKVISESARTSPEKRAAGRLSRPEPISPSKSRSPTLQSLDDYHTLQPGTRPPASWPRPLRTADTRLTVSDPVEMSSEDDQDIGGSSSSVNHKRAAMRPYARQVRASSPIRAPTRFSPGRRERRRLGHPTSKAAPSQSSVSQEQEKIDTAVQSAARKSISNVYERLLREEEKRRKEERERKEAARQRRREEKNRRQEDSQLLARLIGDKPVANTSTADDADATVMDMPPYTSPILAVSPPSTRDTSMVMETSEDWHGSSRDRLHPLAALDAFNASKLATLQAPPMAANDGRTSLRASDTDRAAGLAPAWSRIVTLPKAGPTQATSSTEDSLLDGSSSPIMMPSPSSSDSVRSFTFPNRTSPSASPQPLSPQIAQSPRSEPGTTSSPRRNGHRRGTDREGASQMVSMSARVPAMDRASATTRVQSSIHSPVLERPLEENDDGAGTSKNELRQPAAEGFRAHKSATARRVKFSPKPEIISTFFNVYDDEVEEAAGEEVVMEENGVQRERWAEAEEESGDLLDVPVPSESVKENDKINLDAVNEVDDSSRLSIESAKPLRGSPMKRTFASPRFPGTYFSPAAFGANGATAEALMRSPSIVRTNGTTTRPSSPPLTGNAPRLNLSRTKGPPLSRSWNMNVSFADSSSSSGEPMIVEEEEEDQVTEGSTFWHGVPHQSTPPRSGKQEKKVTFNGLHSAVTGDMRQHKKPHDSAGDSKEMSVQTSPVEKQVAMAIRAPKAGTTLAAREEMEAHLRLQEDTQAIEEGTHRIAAAHKKMRSALIAIPLKNKTTIVTIERTPWLWILSILAILQAVFAMFMINAAHAKAEQMYLTLQYGPLSGPHLMPPRTFPSLVGPLLERWGVLPDVGHLVMDEQDRLLDAWPASIPWAATQLVRPGQPWTTLRLLFAKAAQSCGLYAISSVPLGTLSPS